MSMSDAISLVKKGYENGYGVAQINTNGGTYELTRAIVETMEELNSPVILGAYEANLQYRGYEYAAMQMRWFAERAKVPVAIHLDHGQSLDACRRAIEAGFTSVMIDGSHLPLDENIEQTGKVVEMARPHGITVEAEVGELQKLNPDGSMSEVKNLSSPEEVRRMSTEIDIDMLAVGIGNAHGFYKEAPDIRFDLLEEMAKVSAVPLVLHGTTGLSREVVRKSVSMGMAKVNLGTVIRKRCIDYTAEVIAEDRHQGHPWRVNQEVKERIKTEMREIVEFIGSEGKA